MTFRDPWVASRVKRLCLTDHAERLPYLFNRIPPLPWWLPKSKQQKWTTHYRGKQTASILNVVTACRQTVCALDLCFIYLQPTCSSYLVLGWTTYSPTLTHLCLKFNGASNFIAASELAKNVRCPNLRSLEISCHNSLIPTDATADAFELFSHIPGDAQHLRNLRIDCNTRQDPSSMFRTSKFPVLSTLTCGSTRVDPLVLARFIAAHQESLKILSFDTAPVLGLNLANIERILVDWIMLVADWPNLSSQFRNNSTNLRAVYIVITPVMYPTGFDPLDVVSSLSRAEQLEDLNICLRGFGVPLLGVIASKLRRLRTLDIVFGSASGDLEEELPVPLDLEEGHLEALESWGIRTIVIQHFSRCKWEACACRMIKETLATRIPRYQDIISFFTFM